jgi:3-isopropylmalate dehydratase small subunit
MSLQNLRGRVAWIFEEENFDVDQIVGVKNIKITNVAELAEQAMTPTSQPRSAPATLSWAPAISAMATRTTRRCGRCGTWASRA